jgi:3-deoxy-D-manno-octulosonic-acid transferase
LVFVASLFDEKIAKLWTGQKQGLEVLKEKLDPTARYIWIHAASLGEFEQGRPLIESIKETHPQYKILLTFFSPSGYEVRKNYPLADIICYLPMDTPLNARRFTKMVKPKMAIFIKYEFWANYLYRLRKYNIPTFVVSAIFRKDQAFFRWYGTWYRSLLRNFDVIFVQDEKSADLLNKHGIENVIISGDTRFDRVAEIAEQAKEMPIIDSFTQNKQVLIAGSSWPKDEDLIIEYFNKTKGLKLIIAPHVISKEHIFNICSKLEKPFVRFSEADEKNVKDVDCLIIDAIGFLSSIYRYGDIAYIGGGFGVGIHNILEAAVYGMPVIFGPNYHRFREARQLVMQKGAFPITDYDSLKKQLDKFVCNENAIKKSGENARNYVKNNRGATNIILNRIF